MEQHSSQFDLETLLLDSISGDNEKMQASYHVFMEALKEKDTFIPMFFSLLLNSSNSLAKNVALTTVSNIIKSSWPEFSSEMQNLIVNFIFNYRNFVTEENLRFFCCLVQAVDFHIFDNTELHLSFMKLFSNSNNSHLHQNVEISDHMSSETNSSKNEGNISNPVDIKLYYHYLIEMLLSFNGENGIGDIAKQIDPTLQVIMYCLNEEMLYYQACGIKATGIILDLYPDQYHRLESHVLRILEIAKNTISMPELDFLMIWRNIGSLMQIEPPEAFPLNEFFEIAFEAALKRTDICSEDRLCPLLSFRRNLEYLDRTAVKKIAQLSIEIATDYVIRVHYLPTAFLFFYDTCFKLFPHNFIYEYVRKIIAQKISSNEYASHIIALCLIKSLVEYLPHQIFNDIKMVTNCVESALKQQDVLFLSAACQIIASFHVSFMWNLVDPEFFLNLTIPLLVHENADVRVSAYEAVTRIYDIAMIPCRGSVSMILLLNDKIDETSKWRYLKLLSIAVKKQKFIEKEEAQKLEEFLIALFESNLPSNYTGAITVAIQLMIISENSIKNQILYNHVLTTLENLLQSDNLEFCFHGIHELGNWIQLTQDLTLLEKTITTYKSFERVLNLDIRNDTLLKALALYKVAFIDSMTPNHPFIERLLNEVMPLVESDSSIGVLTSVRVLKYVTLYLSPENAFATFNAIGTACVQTKEISIACKCYKAMAYVVKNCSSEIEQVILPTANHMCELYAKGELSVLEGVPPMSSDSDITLMYNSMMLFIALFHIRETTFGNISDNVQNNMNDLFVQTFNVRRFVFNELFCIYKKGNNMLNEMILYVFSTAIHSDVLTENEITILCQIADHLLFNDLHVVLIMSAAMLLSNLIIKNRISWESLNTRISVLAEWWNRCKNERHKLRGTFSSISLLVWQISFHFKRTDLPLIEESFEEFPPSHMARCPTMASVLVSFLEECFDDVPVNIKRVAAVSICRLLIRPRLELHKRGVPEPIIVKLEQVLHRLRTSDESVQQAVHEFINEVPSRLEIIADETTRDNQ
ncbi:hypothetical protein TRFO_14920 [Tritrichomonas foetus]|uniref:Importin N-terminal domain-containing protein n=1 Tax=Tritrichomonas foetus TaxID=1144522 RepID=A0A1J4KY48_9EUKA|nr:hypothetical protein TRFO_14920 [Tritrichomonas foetus]|eukprot:OHT14628.1 hypothetical protein TRFO_14920 [Tritrichomonas foetus]